MGYVLSALRRAIGREEGLCRTTTLSLQGSCHEVLPNSWVSGNCILVERYDGFEGPVTFDIPELPDGLVAKDLRQKVIKLG